MTYLITQILFCLVAAALIGLAVGYWSFGRHYKNLFLATQPELDTALARHRDLERELTMTRVRTTDLENQLVAAGSRMADLQTELEAEANRATVLAGDQLGFVGSRSSDVESKLQAAEGRAAKLESELSASTGRAEEAQRQLGASQARAVQLEEQLRAVQSRAAELASELKHAQGQGSVLQTQLAVLETHVPANDDASMRSDYPIEEVQGIGRAYGSKLRGVGVDTTLAFVARCREPGGVEFLAKLLRIEESRVHRMQCMADLMRLPGVTGQEAELLEAAGITAPADLANAQPISMSTKLSEINAAQNLTPTVPSIEELGRWSEAARDLTLEA